MAVDLQTPRAGSSGGKSIPPFDGNGPVRPLPLLRGAAPPPVQAIQAPAASTDTGKGYYYGYSINQRERPLREYIEILRRFWYLIVACAIIGLTVGVNVDGKRPTIYESVALVNVGSYVPPTEGPTGQALRFETNRVEYIANLLPILHSYRIGREVLANHEQIRNYLGYIMPAEAKREARAKALGAGDNSGSGSYMVFPVTTLDAYLSHITAEQLAGTTLVTITARASRPEVAADIANAHAKAFIAVVREQRFVAATTNVEFLERRFEEARSRAQETEEKLMKFAKTNNIVIGTRGEMMDASAERYQRLVESLASLSLERAEAAGEVSKVQSGNVGLPNDERSWSATSRLLELRSEYEAVYKNGRNPRYLSSLQAKMDELNKVLRINSRQKVEDARLKQSSVYERERIIKSEMEKLKQDEDGKSSSRLQYAVLDRDARAAKEAFEQVQVRLEDARINAESDQKTVNLIDPALPPAAPSSSGSTSWALSGMLFGAVVGVAIALLLDFQDTSVRTTNDLKALIEMPILGVVPVFTEKKRRKSGPNAELPPGRLELIELERPRIAFAETLESLSTQEDDVAMVHGCSRDVVLITKPKSRESEAFRAIRTTLRYSARNETPRRIVVTSGQKGDGKTTMSVNLAVSLAQTGASTILIDADLRLPRLHEYWLKARNSLGLSDYLAGDREFGRDFIMTAVPTLTIMLAGSPTANPAELLGSHRMEDFMQQLERDFEYIVLDTPPVVEVSDALHLARLVDGVVFVARAGKTPKAVVQTALGKLKQVKANVLGAALNGVTPRSGEGYYYYDSDAYYQEK